MRGVYLGRGWLKVDVRHNPIPKIGDRTKVSWWGRNLRCIWRSNTVCYKNGRSSIPSRRQASTASNLNTTSSKLSAQKSVTLPLKLQSPFGPHLSGSFLGPPISPVLGFLSPSNSGGAPMRIPPVKVSVPGSGGIGVAALICAGSVEGMETCRDVVKASAPG